MEETSPRRTARHLLVATRSKSEGTGRLNGKFDNIFIERLWRSVKYEEVYLKDYSTIAVAIEGLSDYFEFYNYQRLHQALDYQVPAAVRFSS